MHSGINVTSTSELETYESLMFHISSSDEGDDDDDEADDHPINNY